jgi:hypothetical protein
VPVVAEPHTIAPRAEAKQVKGASEDVHALGEKGARGVLPARAPGDRAHHRRPLRPRRLQARLRPRQGHRTQPHLLRLQHRVAAAPAYAMGLQVGHLSVPGCCFRLL